MQEIERVEIVKSPASALFGANAFSGVIHIITKSPERLQGTQISETVGSSGTYISNLLHAGVSDKFGYKLSFEHDRTNHFPNPDIGISNRDKGREDFRGSLFGEYKFDEDSRLSLSAGMDSFERDVDPGIVPGGSVRVLADGGLGFVKLNYSLADFKFQFSWDRLDMDLRSAVLPAKAAVRADSYKLDLQHTINLGKYNVLTGGASYRLHKYHSRFLIGPDRRQNIFAVFLQDEYSPWHNLTLTLGVRLDSHPQTGVNVSPRGSIVFWPRDNHTFRFSVARAFRNPSILENFVDFPVVTPLGTAMIRGNRNLQPEEITSYELGYQTLLSKRVKARIDLFYNDLNNMSTGLTPVAPLELGIATGGGGSVFGGEVALEVLFSEWLKGFVNYSYQNRNLDRAVLGLGPNHKGNVGFSLTLPDGFEADLFANTVGASKGPPGGVGPYTLVNLRLGYKFEGWGVQGRLFLGAFNLFNDRHREFRGGDTIERRITGGLQIKF